MWFHAINSHVDLLVLLYKGPFALETVGWGSIKNIIDWGENSPCPALGTSLRSAVSCTGKKTDTCQSMRHILQGRNCHHDAAVSLSPSQATQEPSVSGTHLKLDRMNLGLRVLSFITRVWSWTQSVRYLTWPCLQLGALASGPAACSWAHHPFRVKGWLGILKLNVSFDVMPLIPSTVNSKFCTIATNQPFPQILWFARGSHLCGHWGAPNESSINSALYQSMGCFSFCQDWRTVGVMLCDGLVCFFFLFRRSGRYNSCGDNQNIKLQNPEQYLTPLQQKEVTIRHLKTKLKESESKLKERYISLQKSELERFIQEHLGVGILNIFTHFLTT